jgi:hypothetical protein
METAQTLKQLRSQYLVNNSTFDSERMQLQCIDMIKRNKPDYFVTLTFAYDVIESVAVGALKTCMWHVNKQVYGRSVKNKSNRLTIFPFMEKSASDGLHFHLLVKQPYNRQNANLQKIFRQKWQAIDVHGFATFKHGEWFKKIDDIDVIAKYITKQTYGNNKPLVIECLSY